VRQKTAVDRNTDKQNFSFSAEVSYWIDRYDTSLDEIQQIFERSGHSISNIITQLNERMKSKNHSGFESQQQQLNR
jgi:hypothetical protein